MPVATISLMGIDTSVKGIILAMITDGIPVIINHMCTGVDTSLQAYIYITHIYTGTA
jgi:hypothetical protein